MLVVEQKVMEVLEICRRVYGVKLGRATGWLTVAEFSIQ
jgi:hypothetical protein